MIFMKIKSTAESHAKGIAHTSLEAGGLRRVAWRVLILISVWHAKAAHHHQHI